MMVTLKDIAHAAGVSIGTVSTVLNDSKGNIRMHPGTRERILAIAQKLDYTPNFHARNLKLSRSNIIGVVSGNLSSSFVPKIIEGIEQRLLDTDYSMFLRSCQDIESFRHCCHIFHGKQVDGVLAIGLIPGIADYFREYLSHVPLVVVCQKNPFNAAHSVYVDGEKIGYDGTRYLLSQGHRRLVFFSQHDHDRLMGMHRALSEAGLPPSSCTVIEGGANFESGADYLSSWLRFSERPTAGIVHSDEIAAGILSSALERGVRIPDDLSLLGTDGQPIARMLHPGLSTVSQPQLEQGYEGASMMLELLAHRQVAAPKILKPQLVIRDTICNLTGRS